MLRFSSVPITPQFVLETNFRCLLTGTIENKWSPANTVRKHIQVTRDFVRARNRSARPVHGHSDGLRANSLQQMAILSLVSGFRGAFEILKHLFKNSFSLFIIAKMASNLLPYDLCGHSRQFCEHKCYHSNPPAVSFTPHD